MIRIWAKITKDEKILKDTIFEDFSNFQTEEFFNYVSDICQELDISTPVILSKHIEHYVLFNNTIFLPQDFPEEVDFDKFILEEASNY